MRYWDGCMPPLVSSVDTVYLLPLRVAQLNNRRNLYNTTLEAPGTQPLAMLLGGFFWRSNRNHFYLFLVLSCHSQCCWVAFSGAVIVITSTSSSFCRAYAYHVCLYSMYVCMHVYLPKFNKQMHYYDPYRSTMGFSYSNILVFALGQNIMTIWK